MARSWPDRADRTPAGQEALKKETDVERHLQDHWGGTSPPGAGELDGDIPFGAGSAATGTASVPATPSERDYNWPRPGTSVPSAWS